MSRSYRMLCPISRALDRLGDRWTMLIVRDLHAGPMRFGEIKDGLPGLATNLLSSRLEKLADDGLVAKTDEGYALTELGRQTDDLLWELARFGMGLAPDPDLVRPGHLRLVAITLQNAMRRVETPPAPFTAALVLDGEPFAIRVEQSDVTVRAGSPDAPTVTAFSSYEPMMAAAGGETSLDEFRREHVRLEGEAEAVAEMRAFMTRVMTEGFAAEE